MPPHAFVTGATGFVGLNLVERLKAQGWRVTAMHRPGSDVSFLAPLQARLVVGDLCDEASIVRVMPDRVDAVYHVAGQVGFWRGANASQTRTNVEGTRAVCRAARAAKARRLVHTSSVVAFGDVNGKHVTEQTPSNATDHWLNYMKSKWLGEQEVLRAVTGGLDAVIVSPCNVIGPYDRTGVARLFTMVAEDRLPAVGPGRASWCHVRDVVDAQIAAVERGREGERYLLGGPAATHLEVATGIARRLGKRPPRVAPAFVLKTLGRLAQWGSAITRRAPDLTPELAVMSSSRWTADSTKAQTELGYGESSLDEMLDDSHRWLVDNGLL